MFKYDEQGTGSSCLPRAVPDPSSLKPASPVYVPAMKRVMARRASGRCRCEGPPGSGHGAGWPGRAPPVAEPSLDADRPVHLAFGCAAPQTPHAARGVAALAWHATSWAATIAGRRVPRHGDGFGPGHRGEDAAPADRRGPRWRLP